MDPSATRTPDTRRDIKTRIDHNITVDESIDLPASAEKILHTLCWNFGLLSASLFQPETPISLTINVIGNNTKGVAVIFEQRGKDEQLVLPISLDSALNEKRRYTELRNLYAIGSTLKLAPNSDQLQLRELIEQKSQHFRFNKILDRFLDQSATEQTIDELRDFVSEDILRPCIGVSLLNSISFLLHIPFYNANRESADIVAEELIQVFHNSLIWDNLNYEIALERCTSQRKLSPLIFSIGNNAFIHICKDLIEKYPDRNAFELSAAFTMRVAQGNFDELKEMFKAYVEEEIVNLAAVVSSLLYTTLDET